MDDYNRFSTMKAPDTLTAANQESRIPLSTLAICGVIVGGIVIIVLFFYIMSKLKSRHRTRGYLKSGFPQQPQLTSLEAGEKVVVEEEKMEAGELETWLRRRSLGRFSETGTLYGSTNRITFEDWPSVRSRSNLTAHSNIDVNSNPGHPGGLVGPALHTLSAPSMSSDSTRVNYSTQPHDIKPGQPKIFMASQYPCVRSVSNPGTRNEKYFRDTGIAPRPRCRPRSSSLGSNFVPSHPFVHGFSGPNIPAPPSRALTVDGMRAGWDIPSWIPAHLP